MAVALSSSSLAVDHPAQPRVAQAFEYDLGIRFHYSQRVFSRPVGGFMLVFAPDHTGAPFLVSQGVFDFIQGFRQGVTVGELLTRGVPDGLPFSKLLDILSFLESRGILQHRATPKRYEAVNLNSEQTKELSVWLHINNHCNLDCEYCFVHKFKSVMDDETFETFATNLESTVEHHQMRGVTVKFAGGEPTLDLPRLQSFHKSLRRRFEARSVRYRSAILSNGTAVTDKLISFLADENVSISISLDGYGEEGHDIFRVYKNSRRGSWQRIRQNIDSLLRRGIHPYITATISARSSKTLPQLVDWIFSNHMRTRLGVVREPEGTHIGSEALRLAYSRLTTVLNENFELAFRLLEDARYRFNPIADMQICELRFTNPSFSACCGIGSSHIVVQDDGRIASCPMTIREPRSRDTGRDLIQIMAATYDVNASARNDRTENCLDCNWFPVCVGGCPVNNERANGNPYTISPLHDFYQYVIPRFLEFTGHKMYQEAARRGMTDFALVDLF
jgi:uncharacterized protein